MRGLSSGRLLRGLAGGLVVMLASACTSGSKAATATSASAVASGSHASATASAPATAAGRSAGHSAGPTSAAPTTATTAAAARLTVRQLPGRLDVPLSRMVTLALPDGSLELLGGLLNGDHSSNRVRTVALPSGTATLTGTLAVGVHDSAGALVAGQAYVYAGGAAHEVATIQRAVPGGASTVVAALPQPRSDLATALVGGTVVVVGGYDGSRTLADVLVSQDGVHFRVLTRLPVPVRYPALLVRGQSVLVYGGDVARRPVDTIQRVDLATGKASVAGHLPHPLSHQAAYTLGGISWLVGGTGPSGTTGVILRSTDGLAFTADGALPAPLSDAGAAVVAGVGYLVGGETATSRTATILSLTPAG